MTFENPMAAERRAAQRNAATAYLDQMKSEQRRRGKDQAIALDRDDGSVRVGPYGISAAMWRTWAAAAGVPGASWSDPKAYEIVAMYAANTLYDQFGNWGLVAIGWKHGPAVAARFAKIYGNTPANEIVQNVLGKGAATFVDRTLQAMAKIDDQAPAMPPLGPLGSPGGSIELKFTPEEGPEEAPTGSRVPASLALVNVLNAMSNQAAGGQRLRIEDVEPEVVPEAATSTQPVASITEEDNAVG